jgi:hypothetical protein
MKQCSKCGGVCDRLPQKYCKACHAAYMREHRPKHRDLSAEARKRANCRAYANTYRRRGLLVRGPCFMCGSAESQMHHADYDKPLEVLWACRKCHLDLHSREKKPPVVWEKESA